jgi:hypothetical protein
VKAFVHVESWAGRGKHAVEVLGATPKRYRVRAIVPKGAVRDEAGKPVVFVELPTPSTRPTPPTRDAWICGFAAGIATNQRNHGHDSHVADALIGNGLTLLALINAGVESFDSRVLLDAISDSSPRDVTARGASVAVLKQRIKAGS